MNLELATVVACDDTGCTVRLVESGAAIQAAYSEKVRDRIRIRRDQLVAVDLEPEQPEIAWRWFRGVVERPGDLPVVRRLDKPDGSGVALANPRRFPVREGDHVYYTREGEEWQVLDRVAGDGPSNPAGIAATLPRIAEQLA